MVVLGKAETVSKRSSKDHIRHHEERWTVVAEDKAKVWRYQKS